MKCSLQMAIPMPASRVWDARTKEQRTARVDDLTEAGSISDRGTLILITPFTQVCNAARVQFAQYKHASAPVCADPFEEDRPSSGHAQAEFGAVRPANLWILRHLVEAARLGVANVSVGSEGRRSAACH